MTDKQQGWNDALNIVIEQFHDVAWQNQLARQREKAAEDMGKRVNHKCQEKSEDDYEQTMFAGVTPFCKMLKRESQPGTPFNIALPEAEKQGRNDALKIVLDTFSAFDHRKGLELDRTCSEIAEDMGKQVEYEVKEWSTASWQVMGDEVRVQAYRQAMNDVVTPFCEMLKGEPQRKPPFNS